MALGGLRSSKMARGLRQHLRKLYYNRWMQSVTLLLTLLNLLLHMCQVRNLGSFSAASCSAVRLGTELSQRGWFAAHYKLYSSAHARR